jgi:hypothetical protein
MSVTANANSVLVPNHRSCKVLILTLCIKFSCLERGIFAVKEESAKAAAALHDYCLLKDRSLASLAQKYGKSTAYVRQLERWSSQYQWVARAAAYDAQQAQALEAVAQEERAKILKSGFALQHKRIELLDRLTNRLIVLTEDDNNLFLVDQKGKRFNDGLFAIIDRYLASIAAEMGERIKRQELSIKELPKLYIDLSPDEDGIEQ